MKKIIIALVALFFVGGVILWVKGKDMHTIETQIEISAPPQKVWEVLMDVKGWESWNPIVNKASGEASMGAQLQVTMKGKDGADGPRYSPKITIFEMPKSFRWTAKMMAGFMFTNDKVFELEATAEGTRLVHKELFRGMLLPLMCGSLDKGVPPMLNSMNQALKEKVEGPSS